MDSETQRLEIEAKDIAFMKIHDTLGEKDSICTEVSIGIRHDECCFIL